MSNSPSGRKFLVIGATGNVGGYVTPGLLERGESVRCMVRDESKAPALREAGAEVVVGDLDDRDSLERAMQGTDTVFLVIANGPNIEQQGRNAVAAALAAGVTRVVRYSVVKIPGMQEMRTAKMQRAVDEVLESSGLQYSHVRPTNYMQQYLMSASTIQSDGAMYFPYGEGKIGMADVRDMADAAIEVLIGDGHEGKSYDITGAESLSLHQVAAAISKVIDKEVKYVDIPEADARAGFLSMGIDEWMADEFLGFFAAFKRGDADITSDDFVKLTGRKQRSIDEFVRDFASAFDPSLAPAAAE